MRSNPLSGHTLAVALFLALATAHAAEEATEPVGGEEEHRIEVPLNEILVAAPSEGALVDHKDLKVTIASGYGVLTFLSITLNGKKVIEMVNIEANGMDSITVPKKHLKLRENTLRVDSWHQLPGQPRRLEAFTTPEIKFHVRPPKTLPVEKPPGT